MKFPVLWSGLCCCTVKCSEILAHIKLLYNPRVNKVFTSLHFTSLKIEKKISLVHVNNQAGQEPSLSQKFKHGTQNYTTVAIY